MDSEIKFSFNDYVACNKTPLSWLLGYCVGNTSLLPIITPGDNESEESNLNSLGEWQEGQGTWRTFPIKQGHWLYQFHGGKVVRYKQRAFTDSKCRVFHNTPDQQFGYSVHCPSFMFLKWLCRHLWVGGTFIWNTGKRGVERHWGGKRGKALWYFTLILSILLRGWRSDMRQPALQGSVGADPAGRVLLQVERPVSFHMGKHQPIISLGSIYFCTS